MRPLAKAGADGSLHLETARSSRMLPDGFHRLFEAGKRPSNNAVQKRVNRSSDFDPVAVELFLNLSEPSPKQIIKRPRIFVSRFGTDVHA
jgi:hypothetical protein